MYRYVDGYDVFENVQTVSMYVRYVDKVAHFVKDDRLWRTST